MSFAIRVDNLGKRYRLGLTHVGSIRELVNRTWKRFLGRKEQLLPHEKAELQSWTDGKMEEDGSFWALRDVSFEVQPSEVVGIIGHNGSGKSTLLKLLSQITAPTTGRVELHGRVASLLEVGTGFHPELSGRENVFLNGAILGMTKSEIRRKFDEIVAFAEIERFIDTPVKRYSSGMYVRLAFAVAAHLDTEILLVDEVLAVGDVNFQNKCLNKMEDVSTDGRTVFFVSHNLQAINQMTQRTILLANGRLVQNGPTHEVLKSYLTLESHPAKQSLEYVAAATKEIAFIQQARVRTSTGGRTHEFGKAMEIEFVLRVVKPTDSLCFSFTIDNNLETRVCHFWQFDPDSPFRGSAGDYLLRCQVPYPRLYMGAYSITTWLSDKKGEQLIENLNNICPFSVSMAMMQRPEYSWAPRDMIYLEDCCWEVCRVTS